MSKVQDNISNPRGAHFLLTPAARDFSFKVLANMTEDEARWQLAELRWGRDGEQVCPSCGSINKHYWISSRKQWRCKEIGCCRTFSVTSDTVFADRKLPLVTLLHAIHVFVSHVKGLSALALERHIGVSYITAFVLLHKLRQVITLQQDKNVEKLKGIVHVDAAHVSGRIRKPRVSSPASKTQARDRIGPAANPTHPNRRLVMVLREVSPVKGQGALRTITKVVRAENEENALELARKYIEPGAVVMTDEHSAYGKYIARFDHQTVNHSREFSTSKGVSNNQAESFFSRMRRMVIGQAHRVTPRYMDEYMAEIAWREDNRRQSPYTQAMQLLGYCLQPYEVGYWQGRGRGSGMPQTTKN